MNSSPEPIFPDGEHTRSAAGGGAKQVLPALYVVDGQPIHVESVKRTLDETLHLLKSGVSFFICTLNLDHLVKLRTDLSFRRAYEKAAFVTADGFPIVVLAWLDRVRLRRTTGADLVRPLCAVAAENDVPIYLVGPTERTLVDCIAQLHVTCPTLKVFGYTAPPWGFDPYGADARAILEQIRSTGARLCFVGLGAPKQELYCCWAAEQLEGVGFIPVGAALEFIAGSKSRAPKWMQIAGFEWLWRLSFEPKRLGERYLKSAKLFAELLWRR